MKKETAARFAADADAAQQALAALEQMFGYYEPLATAPTVAAEDEYDQNYALAA